MEYKEFIRKFVPDVENRLYKWSTTSRDENNFCALVFSEALDNFADLICEKQRGNCIDAVINVDDVPDEFNIHVKHCQAIEKAPQPKINEL